MVNGLKRTSYGMIPAGGYTYLKIRFVGPKNLKKDQNVILRRQKPRYVIGYVTH